MRQSAFASRKIVEMMQAKPTRSVKEKAVPSHRAEKTVADRGSVAASMEAFTGPTSWMPCMMREKATMVPNTTMQPAASQPRRGSWTAMVQLRAARLTATPPTSMPRAVTGARPHRAMSPRGSST